MDPTSFRLFSGASAGATESEYFSFTHPVTTQAASTVDSSGNIYVAYFDFTANVDVVKYDKQGTVLWARRLNTSTGYLYLTCCVVNSSGDLYLGGSIFTTKDYMAIVKLNSSGALQWARQIGNSTGNSILGGERNFMDIDSSGDVYVGGYTYETSTTTSKCFYAKWNSSGTLQAQESFGASSSPSFGHNKVYAVDASGSFPVFVGTNDVSGNIYPYAIQFSSGSGATAKTINSLAGTSFADVKVNGSNVYIGQGFDFNKNGFVIFTFNTSLTVVRQRALGTTSAGNIKSIDVDSSGNIYATGASNEGNVEGRYDCLIAKWNSSGGIQWSRYFGRKNNSTSDETGLKIFHDNTNSNLWMFNANAMSGTNYPTTGNTTPNLYFPDDGSLTGDITHTTGTYEYKSTNLTEFSTSFTASTATASRTTESYTEAAASTVTSSTISPSGLTVVSQP